jgi:hypothetical protein
MQRLLIEDPALIERILAHVEQRVESHNKLGICLRWNPLSDSVVRKRREIRGWGDRKWPTDLILLWWAAVQPAR